MLPRLAALVAAVLIALPAAEFANAQDAERPSFVIILVDDLGWSDLGCYGSNYYETPNIDRLAASGIRFTDGYAACAVCSPTRAALLTGRYPARIGITDWIRARFQGGKIPEDGKNPGGFDANGKEKLQTPRNPLWMELHEVTLAEALRPAGYVSCHIGKWHLGADAWSPNRQGFDFNIGGCDYGQPPRYFFPYESPDQPAMPGLETGHPGEYLTDREAAEAVRFIENNKDKPFLLYLAHYAVHTPIEAQADLIEKYNAKPKGGQTNATYAAMIESVDNAVGRVLDKLDELNLVENTAVIFTSDNGGLAAITKNAPLRAGKGTPYEGGIRVPYLVRWPRITTPGRVCRLPISTIDLFPTVLELAEVPPPDHTIDGESLAGVLDGETELERAAIFWHFPHYRGGIAPYGVVRDGDFKLIRFYDSNRTQLYNLAEDIGETNDVSETMPEKAKQLDLELSKWLIGVGAKMPQMNPDDAP